MRYSPRYLGIEFRALAVEAAFGFRDDHPRAVRQEIRGRMVLHAVNRAAEQSGVRAGMTEAAAKANTAELIVRDRDVGLELSTLERASERLLVFGPELEVVPPRWALLEVSTITRRSPSEELDRLKRIQHDLQDMGHEICLAVADEPETAQTFARAVSRGILDYPSQVYVVAPGQSRSELQRMPLRVLAWTEQRVDPDGTIQRNLIEVCETARALGIETIHDFLEQSPTEWITRFGLSGRLLVERARADAKRRLHPFVPPEKIEEWFELDTVTEDLEPILFILRRLLHRIDLRLEARAQAAQTLVIVWQLEPGMERKMDIDDERPKGKLTEIMTVSFAQPTRDSKTMLSVLREKIGGALPGAILSIRIRAEQAESHRGTQLDLFSRRAQKIEDMAELLGRLTAALGEAALFSPQLCDTHRPEEGWRPAPFSIDEALHSIDPIVQKPSPKIAPVVPLSSDRSSLPAVTSRLSVIGSATTSGAEPKAQTGSEEAAWPKPKKRVAEDEPPSPLPPRPLDLLDPPEPARFISSTILQWRGQNWPFDKKTHGELFQTEWWKPKESERLERHYFQLHLLDGRILWAFARADREHFVHGIFD